MTHPSPTARPEGAASTGVFLAFEGGEGCGKSTQVPLLAQRLRERGHQVRTTFEPGDGVLGQAIRSIVLDPGNTQLSDRAEALLYAADRAQHVATTIAPALLAGQIVITDRYVDSSLAYQSAGRGQPFADIAHLSAWATQGLVPALTVLLDIPVEVGLARARGRAATDRLEAESHAFHERVRQTFLFLADADPGRYLVLDGLATPQALAVQIAERVEALLAGDVASKVPW
ncbi:MAG: dTMP kinase [Actinomycetota bacterium]|nr:dTMP kinase [Actinomycetota bacterium]